MEYIHLRKDLTQDDLAEICCKLNDWEWDERLGEKPEGFDRMPAEGKHPIVFPLLLQIRRLVPPYKLTRARLPFRLMSEAEYDEWYSTHKIEPMLDEWYSLNERRNAWGCNAYGPRDQILERRPQKRQTFLSKTVAFFREYLKSE